jgi:hypothetical protein
VIGGLTPVKGKSRKLPESNCWKDDDTVRSFHFTLRHPHGDSLWAYPLKTQQKQSAIWSDSHVRPRTGERQPYTRILSTLATRMIAEEPRHHRSSDCHNERNGTYRDGRRKVCNVNVGNPILFRSMTPGRGTSMAGRSRNANPADQETCATPKRHQSSRSNPAMRSKRTLFRQIHVEVTRNDCPHFRAACGHAVFHFTLAFARLQPDHDSALNCVTGD